MKEMSDVIVSDTFYYCTSPKNNYQGTNCQVSLTPFSLTIQYSNENESKSIKIEDVIGCHCMRNKVNNWVYQNHSSNNHANSVFLSLYFYGLTKSFTKSLYRKRETVLLRFCKHATFEENCEVIARWHSAILALIQPPEVLDHGLAICQQASMIHQPRLLIFVNPNSGQGAAVKNFNTKIRPLLGEANIAYDLVVTSHPNQCKQMVEDCTDIAKYTGLVAVSGDGLLFEIYNGLLARDDWERLSSLPVGIIAQGSGNGLARSLAHINGEPYLNDPLLISTLNTIKLRSRPMDLVLVSTASQAKSCGFLSVGWGLLSDIDIESERLRMIGEARFTVWAFARVIRLRTYKATISYLPANEGTNDDSFVPLLPPLNEPLPTDQGWVTLTGEFICVYSSLVPFIGSELCFAPQAKLDDGVTWLMIMKAPLSKLQVIQFLLGLEDGSYSKYPWLTFVPVKAFRLVPELNALHQSHLTVDGEKLDSQAIQVTVLPSKGRVFIR